MKFALIFLCTILSNLAYSATNTVVSSVAATESNPAEAPVSHAKELYALAGILVVLLPVLVQLGQMFKLWLERKPAENLRESQVIKDIIEHQKESSTFLSQKVESRTGSLEERLKEANISRENLREETVKTFEYHKSNIDDLRKSVASIQAEIGILKNENKHQNNTNETLAKQNEMILEKIQELSDDIVDLISNLKS